MRKTVVTLVLFTGFLQVCQPQTLRIVTMNAWSGLTYNGTWSIGAYENGEAREDRIRALIHGLRKNAPDVIALQEVNPVGRLSGRIADALGYDVISQRVLAGIKVGPLGIPSNMNEGLAILARPDRNLTFVDVIPLSSGFGAFGDVLSFHLNEENAALIGSIRTETGEKIILVNIHLPASPDDSPQMQQLVSDLRSDQDGTSIDLSVIDRLNAERNTMIRSLLQILDERFEGEPLILLGDFNVAEGSSAMSSIVERPGYVHASRSSEQPLPSWDAAANPLTRLSSEGNSEILEKRMDELARSVDHIVVRSPIGPERITSVDRILDQPYEGTFASDHFGIMMTLDMTGIRGTPRTDMSAVDFLPIFSYDTDVGFGYGVKAFFLDQLEMQESFDLIAFNSTEGERWYKLVWSMPDFELRQGTVYPFAVDVTIDYDRFLKSAFFGLGPAARLADREVYTKELFEAQALVSRGLSQHSVAQAGLRYRRIKHSNFSDTSAIPRLANPLSSGTAGALSLHTSFRHDTRNSYINPSRGFVLQGDIEYAPSLADVSFGRITGTVQYFATLLYPKTVLALRAVGQTLIGPQVPLQFLLPLGGNRTIRGLSENRFFGRTSVVSNAEIRFPLIWRFGGILGYDAGKIWMSPDTDHSGWQASTALGLRFYVDTFIVRADLGFSSETTGFYLNFGHIF